MFLLSAVLIAVVSNLDNLAAGFAFGMRGARIALGPNAVIAGVTMAGTAAAMSSGRAISRLLPPPVASVVGSSIIVTIGVASVVASVRGLREPGGAPIPKRQLRRGHRASGTVSWREALLLGVALSLNNVASGVGAGIAGISPLATTLLAGAFSLICVGGGSQAGSSLARLLTARAAGFAAGVVLLAVGAATLVGVG